MCKGIGECRAITPSNAAVIQGVQGRYFQLVFLLIGWALVCAAPFGKVFQRWRAPLLILGLVLQTVSLLQGMGEFRFYWAS